MKDCFPHPKTILEMETKKKKKAEGTEVTDVGGDGPGRASAGPFKGFRFTSLAELALSGLLLSPAYLSQALWEESVPSL